MIAAEPFPFDVASALQNPLTYHECAVDSMEYDERDGLDHSFDHVIARSRLSTSARMVLATNLVHLFRKVTPLPYHIALNNLINSTT